MGSFAGHIDEAIFFIGLALWWMYNVFPAHIKAKGTGKAPRSTMSFGLHRWPNVPIEAILKTLFPVGGFIAEIFASPGGFIDSQGNFQGLHRLQHMSIYGIFILHGLVDTAVSSRQVPLPRGLDYVTAVMAFAWYGLSFRYHVMMPGKEGLETVIHVLPTYGIFLLALAVLLEWWRPRVFLITATRIYCLLLLGTWFFQCSFILYLPAPFPGPVPNPAWDRHDERNVHFMVALYGYHVIANLAFLILAYLAIHLYLRWRGQVADDKRHKLGHAPLLNEEESGQDDLDL